MIDLNDVLLAMSNIPVDDPIAEIWGRGLQGGYKISEYTGSLPITITDDGNALLDYRIYGADGGVGEPTENLFDPNAKNVDNGYIAKAAIDYPGGEIHDATSGYNTSWVYVSEYIPVDSNTNYIIFTNLFRASVYWARGIAFYDENKNFISTALGYVALVKVTYKSGVGRARFTTPENCRYIRTNVDVGATMLMLVAASTPPPTYIPYGYKLPMVTHPELKDIGDTVLVDGEEWDIVNYNSERTVATLCKKKVTGPIPMAQKEALFAFPNGLTAGTYHFTMPQTAWYLLPNDSEKNIEFTLINDVPANGQLFVTQRNNSLIGGTISCYANPTSTTVLETATLSEGDGGSSLESPMYLDDPVGNVNNLLCVIIGSSMYKNCSIRQWLNSTSPAGNVWTPANKFDRPPTWVSTLDGFMYGMDTDFVDAVATTTFITASGKNKSYQLVDKFVIPSYTEISGVANYGVLEGEQYQYYTGASADRRKKFNANDASRRWWLRSIGPYSLVNIRYIRESGSYDYQSSSSNLYIAPTCQIDLTKLSNPWLQNNMYKSRATTTHVYIGENQLDSVEGVSDYVDKSNGKIVRMIGEYTFTGDESFNKYGNSDVFYTSTTIDPVGITTVNTITMRCNHPAFTAIENKDTRYWLNPEADDICCFLPGGRSQVFLRSTSKFTTATECKAYLKTQYDNGTPVKISYWLKTPIEEAPPVPFPEIPTIDGETVIDYDGEPKPPQMYVKYKGKAVQ